ncbi:MAG TPA: hypothetical protein VFV33_09570, partial [Gemmatimonadaceae bacterium]|nr:hypothetical protein [Gemmatimonadaceae bacterium]
MKTPCSRKYQQVAGAAQLVTTAVAAGPARGDVLAALPPCTAAAGIPVSLTRFPTMERFLACQLAPRPVTALCARRIAALALVWGTIASAAHAPPSHAQAPARPAGRAPLPLEGTRSLRFTATKGTWMSVDVSPDGQRLVVDLLGDLYTLPIGGGAATRLTSGMAHDAQPRWSPDGQRIAFISDRSGGNNVWVIAADGRDTVQLSKTTDDLYVSPEWTPDGKYVAVTRSAAGGAPRIFLYHVDGGAGIQVIREPAGQMALGATFTPDGRYLWYATRQGVFS